MTSIRRHLLVCLLFFGAVLAVHAAMNAASPYTNRGQADFDTFLQLLNPDGTWSKIGDKWAYTPTDHLAPYTNGRWLYTEFGWYWKGNAPHSWATEHYGFWKRGEGGVWSWYPGPFWLPEIVELRMTDKYIGWRSAEVDNDGSYVEAPIDRYIKFDEWTFVPKQQFPNPITPATTAKPEIAKTQLEDSTDCRHTYLTYRIIDRPGPHPADQVLFCDDGGMLPPRSLGEIAATKAVAPELPAAAAKMTGTEPPMLLDAQDSDVAVGDKRQVKYWVTMSLPSFWAKPPPDTKPEQIYMYRPDIYQDNDGIQRRITLWFNPQQRTTLKELMTENAAKPSAPGAPAPAATAAAPAVPAEAAPGDNPFQSPLDDSPRGAASSHPASNGESSKGAATSGTTSAPSGMAN